VNLLIERIDATEPRCLVPAAAADAMSAELAKGRKHSKIFTGQISAKHNLPVYCIYSQGDFFLVFSPQRATRCIDQKPKLAWRRVPILCLSVQGCEIEVPKILKIFPFNNISAS